MTSVQELRDLGELPAGDVAARVEGALDEAKRRGPADVGSLELDREIVQLIRGSRDRDSILDALELERLAGTLERRTSRSGRCSDGGWRRTRRKSCSRCRRAAALRA